MRSPLILAFAFALSAPGLLPAQSIYLNDNQTRSWTDDAPRVRVWFEGSRAVPNGAPMRVRFEVSDNAFVTVVRVDDDGRMTILFPRSRSQRAAVRADRVYFANDPRLGSEVSFRASGRMGGYVFALATYAPLDLSRFEYRDFERIGGWSAFTQVNRPISRRPDVFIDRFAAAVLWDKDTPYDYDVDYYFPTESRTLLHSAYAMCGSSYMSIGLQGYGQPWEWSDWDIAGYPLRSMCRSWYSSMQCFTYLTLNSYTGCGQVVVANPTAPPVDQPADTAGGGGTPNEGVIRGGLFGPTPIPVIPVGSEQPETERAGPRFDQVKGIEAGRGNEWDNIMSIPARATRKMKEEDARRERNADAAPARAFDRADFTNGKTEKSRTADASNAAPPSREPTKVKSTGEIRPDRRTGSTVRTATGYGTSSTGRSNGPDRVSRPAETKPAGATSPNPPSVQGTTGDKKKPPKN